MRKLMLLLPIAAMGCAAQGGNVPVGHDQVPSGSTCQRTGALDTFKGQVASAELGARIMTAARAPKLRWVPYGAIITMEFSPNRVTVRLDQQNRVLSVTCG